MVYFHEHTVLDSVFWVESQFPTGRQALFQVRKDNDKIIEWSPQYINVKNTGN